ncbi:hypothetical protein RM190_09045 [Paracoccus sp. CPCC 101403]|uniref:Phage baseplate protein n=1 Tax=Paracoccus broussonetiae TaxID=3075834 RepID=A0ABU3EEZ2_9RHOB|nr:hypothetical protein [Paracoccus sp. CPCC 101403]MDT1062000.1 hypothetical protein [Paracoccus sp. CPCC 101403]
MRHLTGQDEIAFHAATGPTGRHARLAGLVAGLGLAEADLLPGLSLAEWEGLLLDLLVALDGPRIDAEARCPACGVGNSLIFPVRDLPREPAASPVLNGRALHLHLADLLALEAEGLEGEAGLSRLLSAATELGKAETVRQLWGPDRDAAILALEQAAAGLGLEIATACTGCGEPITLPFDVADYVDAELRNRAQRLLDEVHLIALSYHWSEAEILSLPHARRQDYLRRILASQVLSAGAGRAEGG